MLSRKPVFPHVIEMNVQAGQRLGCNVYLVFDGQDCGFPTFDCALAHIGAITARTLGAPAD